MHRCIAGLLAVICICAIALPAAYAQEQYTLQYKFEKGKVYLYRDTIVAKSSQEMMGQEMKSTSTVQSMTRIVPSDIKEDGTAELMVSFDTLRIAVKSPQADTTIVPTGMLGKRSRMRVSRTGDFTKREVVDTVKMEGAMRGVAMREPVRFHALPTKPVKIGEKWVATRPDTNDTAGSQIVTVSTIEYTLLSKETNVGKECLKVSYAGTIAVTGKGSMMGNSFFIEGTGKTAGTCFLDPVSGMTLSDESTMDMESSIAITGQQNMTIPSSQSVTTHRTLIAN